MDSEGASARAWSTTLARFGYELDPDVFAAFVGTTDRALAAAFAHLVAARPAEILAVAEREMRAIASSGLPAFADAVQLLAGLPGRPAVASNSDRWRLDVVLAAARLDRRFEVSVSGDEVAHPKPEPDVYLEAARLMLVDALDCVVIEDSPTGVSAARAAGMTVIAVDRGHFSRHALAAADVVVSSLTEPVVLSRLGL